jgi:hypothetical protein
VLALAEESAVIADYHPPSIELETGGANDSPVKRNATAGLHRIDEETGNADQSESSEYRSTAPAAVVLAG